jgi:SAM-dependent methyltransferase
MRRIRSRLRAARRVPRVDHDHPSERGMDGADNVAYNRELWNWYAEQWQDPTFGIAHADRPDDLPTTLETIGDEWGRRSDVDAIVKEFILPFVRRDSIVAEIGCGGGRIAERLVGHVALYYGFDISRRMLELARGTIRDPRARFVLLEDAELPDELGERFDFVFAFDVFLHLDLYVMRRYLEEMARVLKTDGKAFVHTTNLTSDAGWDNFVKFERYRPETHFYVSPETVRTLARRSGFTVLKESVPDSNNFYLARDYLAVLAKH